MNIKVEGSELNRMMKTISQCIDSKHPDRSNVEISVLGNLLVFRASNGQIFAKASTPIIASDEEVFCVDGALFSRVCSMCAGNVTMSTDGKALTVSGVGRARLPIVDANIPTFDRIGSGTVITVHASVRSAAYSGVAHAIATDQNRIALTGIKTKSLAGELSMTTLDGFRIAYESFHCDGNGEEIDTIIPGTFMKLLCNSMSPNDVVVFTTDGKKIKAEIDGLQIGCTLLSDGFPDISRVVPKEFTTNVIVDGETMKTAIKNNGIVCSSAKLVKLIITDERIVVTGNSEDAEYVAEVECSKNGPDLTIAFNIKYLLDTFNSMPAGNIIINLNGPRTACVFSLSEAPGYRLLLPVRIDGGV